MLDYQTPGVAVHDLVTLDLVDEVQPGVAQAVGDDGIHVQADGFGVEGRPVAEGHAAARAVGGPTRPSGDISQLSASQGRPPSAV